MSTPPACLYQETRLDLNPSSPAATVEVFVSSNSSFFSSRQSPKRRRLDHAQITHDENYFSAHHLATESAIHFRPLQRVAKKQNKPRAILWRILNEREQLELQAVDFHQDRADRCEPLLSLRIHLPAAIRPSCVAFVENSTEQDAFVAFVSTQSGELFSLTLTKDLFTKKDLAGETTSWVKISKPNVFSYRPPFKLFAQNDKELWATLTDGAVVRLESGDGITWRESFFTQTSWKASMRGLIPWRASTSVRFEDMDLHPNTVISFGLSPNGSHLWAVCLDHTLRAWNVDSGKLVFSQDLALDAERDLEKPLEQGMPPTRAQLLQILPPYSSGQYMMVTFSPSKREFKFWLIKGEDVDSSIVWEDAQEKCTFSPPIDDLGLSSVWSLESFNFDMPSNRKSPWMLWILVRSGSQCHTYKATFSFNETHSATMKTWRNNWVAVSNGFDSSSALKENLSNPTDSDMSRLQIDGIGQVDRWLEFLFSPGRFTSQTLETALVVYLRSPGTRSTKVPSQGATDEATLKSRISQAVGSSVQLELADSDELAYERYERNLAAQWQIFYGVVKDLHTRREKVLGLSYDEDENLAWIIRADFVCPLRACSESEIIWHNRRSFANPLDLRPGTALLNSLSDAASSQSGQLLFALDIFRNSFPKAFLWKFVSVMESHILDNGKTDDILGLIQSIYDASGFSGQVSDEDYNNLTDAIEPLGGFARLDNALLNGILDTLGETQQGGSHDKHLTRCGADFLVRGAQDTLQLSFDIVLSLLLFVTFVAGELEEGDLAESFDAAEVFSNLAVRARHFKLLNWLATTTFNGVNVDKSKEKPQSLGASILPECPPPSTLLEYMFMGDWSMIGNRPAPTPELLTHWCRAWIFGIPLATKYDNVSCDILGTLLKTHHHKLAQRCLCFLPETPWAEYLSARVSLVTSQFSQASLRFKRAAQGLSAGKLLVPAEIDSTSLLDGIERTQLNDGFAKFYQHVADLFNFANASSYAADFAQMALEALEREPTQSKSLRADLLSLLFSASLRTSQFERAFSALIQQTDMPLRKSSLKALVQDILKANQIKTLLTLPYPVDLAVEADDQLESLAAKSSTPSVTVFDPSVTDPSNSSYHKLLYAFRLQRNDLRGAASCIWERLEILLKEQRRGLRGEDMDEEVEHSYLALINTLSLMDKDQAWILTKPSGTGEEKEKRRVVTLEDIRRLWQEELDRVADLAAGRFSFGFRDMEMEVEA